MPPIGIGIPNTVQYTLHAHHTKHTKHTKHVRFLFIKTYVHQAHAFARATHTCRLAPVTDTRKHQKHVRGLAHKFMSDVSHEGIFALRAHCALLLDYVPPEEPPSKPLGNTLRIR